MLKKWSDGHLKILKLMGEVLANALEHKRKDMEIKENEYKYRTIFEQIHDVYFETKIDGTMINVSPSVRLHLGFEPDELIGVNIADIYVQPEKRTDILETLNRSGCIDNHIAQLKKKDGSAVDMSANAHLIYGKNGEPEKIAGIARDITEIKKIHKMLLEAKLLLENASNTQNEFLSIVNHELRTPLSHVMGFSEILMEGRFGLLNPKQLRYVLAIESAGKKLFDLLTSLNHIAEIEGGKMELDLTEFSLSLLVSDIRKITGSMASKKNIDIKFNISLQLDSILADRSKLKTILINLISNAIKFTPEGGNVSVDIKQDEKRSLHFSVKDTGIGISEEDQKALFKPFVQLEKTLDRKHGGAGLGLALAKEFVEIQGGNIRVESRVGNGSTFEFTIPGNLSG